MIVSAGLAGMALGNTELSQIHKLPTSKLRPPFCLGPPVLSKGPS